MENYVGHRCHNFTVLSECLKMPTMTVIRVKYVGRNAEDEKEPGAESSANGNPEEVLVNIDCPIGLIIDYIRETASVDGEIDLCEESSNRMKKVSSYPGWERGTDILESGAVYFIIKIERDAGGKISRVVPVIPASRSSKIAAEIMSTLHGPPARRRSSSVTRKVSQDKIGKKNNQEKRTKISKPASRAT